MLRYMYIACLVIFDLLLYYLFIFHWLLQRKFLVIINFYFLKALPLPNVLKLNINVSCYTMPCQLSYPEDIYLHKDCCENFKFCIVCMYIYIYIYIFFFFFCCSQLFQSEIYRGMFKGTFYKLYYTIFINIILHLNFVTFTQLEWKVMLQ